MTRRQSTTPTPADARTSGPLELAQPGDIVHDLGEPRATEADCECDDCDCPVCYPGCC